ncbi:hypothetical protein M9194_06515 [Vibrio sp. S4M6]|uniref:hypothetical protein n=1 Tax=Vibrio sinus TaxID=2946865 RepID=UPI002029B8A3|nr:hypothetical protein [Vibrio sinus]MCL9781078.1 hypothetical protein [Vibrio sinus]
MHKWRLNVICLPAFFLLLSCSASSKQEDIYQQTVATIGNSGSTTGPHGVASMWLQDTRGSASDFGYGAIHGYPSKSSGINIGVPKHVEGYWIKFDDNDENIVEYYRISAPIDYQLAAKKIDTLNHYYQNFERQDGTMQVIVDGPRVRVFFTKKCFRSRADCTPNNNADPQGYIERSPTNSTDVVKLFDGMGEASNIPFPNSPFDQRQISQKFQLGRSADRLIIKDTAGNIETYGSGITSPTQITAFWRTLGQDTSGNFTGKNKYFRLIASIDGEQSEKAIQTLRNYYKHFFGKVGSIYVFANNGQLSVIYSNFCFEGVKDCRPKQGADPNHLIKYSDVLGTNYVTLYQGKAESSNTPFPDGPDYNGDPRYWNMPEHDSVKH